MSEAPSPAPTSGSLRAPRAPWPMVALALCLAFAAWTLLQTARLDPTARDQDHDLGLAIRIRHGADLSDGNRHPLYPAVLAPVAGRDAGFYDRARVVSAAVAGASLFLVYLAVARALGAGAALLTLLAVALEFRLQARRVCPEPLFAACLALAASAVARGRTWAAGLWSGLAWLAKGSALLSLPAVVLAAWAGRAPSTPGVGGAEAGAAGPSRPGGARGAGLVLLGFLVAASPLLLWNTAAGRSPLYNVNSAHVLWEDRWEPGLDERSRATPSSWLASHSLADGAERLARGLVGQRGVEWLWASLALLLLLGGRRRDAAARRWRLVAVGTVAAWLPAMAWYAPVVASRRLLFPVFAVVAAPALASLWTLVRVRPGWAPRAAKGVAVAAVAAAVGLAVAAASAWTGIDEADREAAAVVRAAAPRGASVPRGCLVRPSRTHPPHWMLEGDQGPEDLRVATLPPRVSDADALAWLRREGVDLVLLNEGLLRHRPGAFPGARWDDARGVVLDRVLEGLESVALVRARGAPVRYALLRVVGP